MTCNSGAIDYPLTPWNICITEDMMRVKDGGAIACFVPSGPGITSLHREMSKSLGRAIFDCGLRGFGELTTLAKAQYALAGTYDDMIFMYHLLGDPVASLQLVGRRGSFTLQPAARPRRAIRRAGPWLGSIRRPGNGSANWPPRMGP